MFLQSINFKNNIVNKTYKHYLHNDGTLDRGKLDTAFTVYVDRR